MRKVVLGFLGLALILGFAMKLKGQTREHPYFVNSIDISPNEQYIAIGRIDHKLVLYNLEKKEVVKIFSGKPDGGINSDSFFTPDNKYWIVQGNDLILRFWDIEKKAFKKGREIPLDSEANGLIFLNDGKSIVWGGTDGRIEFLNLETKEKRLLKKPVPKGFVGFEEEIMGLVLSPDGTRFTSMTDTTNYEDPEEDYKPIKEGKDYELKHTGVNLWDAQSLTKIKKLIAKDTSGSAWSTFSPDGKYVYTSYENGTVRQWDAKDGELVREFTYHEGQGECVSVLENSGKWVGTFTTNVNEINIIDVSKTAEMVFKKFTHNIVTGQLTTIPRKNLIITGDTDGSISVYRFNAEKLAIELLWHPRPVKSGLITWVSPLSIMEKSEKEGRKMIDEYIAKQKRKGYGKGSSREEAIPTDPERIEELKQKELSQKKEEPKTSHDPEYSGVTLGPGVSVQ